jgi:hypothetical protein
LVPATLFALSPSGPVTHPGLTARGSTPPGEESERSAPEFFPPKGGLQVSIRYQPPLAGGVVWAVVSPNVKPQPPPRGGIRAFSARIFSLRRVGCRYRSGTTQSSLLSVHVHTLACHEMFTVCHSFTSMLMLVGLCSMPGAVHRLGSVHCLSFVHVHAYACRTVFNARCCSLPGPCQVGCCSLPVEFSSGAVHRRLFTSVISSRPCFGL